MTPLHVFLTDQLARVARAPWRGARQTFVARDTQRPNPRALPTEAPPESWHGSYQYGYIEKGCRCQRCVRALTEQRRAQKKGMRHG